MSSASHSISLDLILSSGIESEGTIEIIDSYLNELYATQTSLGAIKNRLSSALNSISVAMITLFLPVQLCVMLI